MLQILLLLALIPQSFASCNQTCGHTTVPFPFGFSPSCGMSLSCNSTSGISFSNFPLLNFTANNTILLSLPSNCTQPINSLSALFGRNYAMTQRNGLFLGNCTNMSLKSPCVLPAALISEMSQFNNSCGRKGGDITCFSNRTGDFLSEEVVVQNACTELFTSVFYDQTGNEEQTLLVLRTVEVGWWMTGDCRCSPDASCTRVGHNGFSCECNEGCVGDGFADGTGCAKGKDDLSPYLEDEADTNLKSILNPNAEYQVFDLNALRNATNNFSDMNKLGKGGFGPVYMGTLPNGREIAVKRLSGSSKQGLRELKNEVDFLAKLKHKNLVQLLGCCIQKQEKLLCYEYLQNGSLDKILFEKDHSKHLNWKMRYKIIEGISRGLHYLHDESHLKIIHRDLKASNILLDKDRSPKISDFGLARFFEEDQTHKDTSIIAGTFGYMAPEYVLYGNFSAKSDVYSFGVLLLEIVTGQKNSSFAGSGRASNLISYAWQHWTNQTIHQMKDTILKDENIEDIKKCIHIALLRVQEEPIDRPNMEAVNLMLGGYSATIPAIPYTKGISGMDSSINQEEFEDYHDVSLIR